MELVLLVTKKIYLNMNKTAILPLQEISNGRLEFRTGAGATHDCAVQWWYPFGIDYPNRAERISLLDEGLHVLRSLWSKPEVHFSGKYFKINGANLKNPTTPISITVGS